MLDALEPYRVLITVVSLIAVVAALYVRSRMSHAHAHKTVQLMVIEWSMVDGVWRSSKVASICKCGNIVGQEMPW